MGSRTPGKSVARSAEHLMRQWALAQEVHQRVEDDRKEIRLADEIHPYVALSRQAGASGSEIARRVGQELGWEVIDRELLAELSTRYNSPRELLESVDETKSNWLLEVFGNWIDERLVTQTEYVVHAAHTLLLAARQASHVFVGRGAPFVLPREKGLSIEIIAPLKQRIERIMEKRDLDRAAAEKHVKEVDKGRHDFVKTYFHHDVSDPGLYDLVLNMEHMATDDAVELISSECRRRFMKEAK